ncbi:carboxypeptidase regulatory-like domain-containing protein [Gemmatimonadota bacterium]
MLVTLGLALAAFPGSSPAQAQLIQGQVIVSGDTLPVEGAELTLIGPGEQPLLKVQSDENGQFRMPVPRPGSYRVVAERIGFVTVSVPVAVEDEEEVVVVEIRMSETAIPLEPLVVVARRRIRPGSLDEFYERMERNTQRGLGHFVTAEDVEAAPPFNTSALFRAVPRMEVRPSGPSDNDVFMRVGGELCRPDIYLDGLPVMLPEEFLFDNLVSVVDLEGVEIYRGQLERVEGYSPSTCGLILLWRKEDRGGGFSWRRLFFGVGLAALFYSFTFLM